MKRTMIIIVAVAVVLGAIAFWVSPSFRTRVVSEATKIGQWTPEAIQKDPVGYSNFVESQLKADLEKYSSARQALASTMNDLAKKLSDKTKLLERGDKMAETIADAIEAGKFPVTVLGKEYLEAQLRSQLSLTLAEIDGLRESLTEIEKILKSAEQENEKIVVNLEKTESQLALLATRREIFKAQATSAEGLSMIAQCNAVLEQNQMVFAANPVRTISQMISDLENISGPESVSADRVEEYLSDHIAKKGGKKNSLVKTKDIPSEPGKVQAPASTAPQVQKPTKPQEQKQSQTQSPVTKK